MCLIVFAWQVVPCTPLVVAANRDEYFARPTAAAHWWPENPQVFGGRDLLAGGSWMGISQSGPNGPRFAGLTIIRSPQKKRTDAPSRGELVADFLRSDLSVADYLQQVQEKAQEYNGFNLLLGEADNLVWYSNRGDEDPRNGQSLAPGIYGVSNALLDVTWPKVVKTKAQFGSLICQRAPKEAYFEMLADSTLAPDGRLPNTGVSLEFERILSAVCVESEHYGTRSSTVVKLNREGGPELHEHVVR